MSGDALTFSGIRKRYGALNALGGVTLRVPRGGMFGLIGPDGAGKTTAIRVACGLLRPDGGEVRVGGHDPLRERRLVTRMVGYLSQRFSLYGDLTIDENIAFQAEIHGVRDFAAARDRLLAMTGLTSFRGRRADRLSGGMKQKLALACTLVHTPEVLLLDEPTTGVDPVSRREFWKLLAEFRAQGLTVIMATPYLDEAERCGTVAMLHQGRLLALDDPATLRASMPGTLLEVIVDGARPPIDLLASLEGVEDAQVFGDAAHVRCAGHDAAAASEGVRQALLRAATPAVSVREIPPSLEDVFIQLVTRQAQPRAAVS